MKRIFIFTHLLRNVLIIIHMHLVHDQEEEASNTGSHGMKSMVVLCREGTGKSDSGHGSVGTGSSRRYSVTSSTGRHIANH